MILTESNFSISFENVCVFDPNFTFFRKASPKKEWAPEEPQASSETSGTVSERRMEALSLDLVLQETNRTSEYGSGCCSSSSGHLWRCFLNWTNKFLNQLPGSKNQQQPVTISVSSPAKNDFQCETCGKVFRNDVVLAAHSRTHNLSKGITVTYMQSVR